MGADNAGAEGNDTDTDDEDAVKWHALGFYRKWLVLFLYKRWLRMR